MLDMYSEDSNESRATSFESASSFDSSITSNTSDSNSDGTSSSEDYYAEKPKPNAEEIAVSAIRKRNRRMMAFNLRLEEKENGTEDEGGKGTKGKG